jgi:hypothetical protein
VALSNMDQLRLYLRDSLRPPKTPFFLDNEIEVLIEQTSSVEEAASLGWLLKAGSTSDAPTTITIGQMSETRGQATESFNIAMAMHNYWKGKAALLIDPDAGTARWMQISPGAGTFIGDLQQTIEDVEAWFASDFSRLTL